MFKTMSAALMVAASPFAILAAAPAAAQMLSPAQAAAAFGAREKIIDASISPAGDQVAIILPGDGQSTLLAVTNLTTGKSEVITSADGDPLSLTWCGWVSNSRLVCNSYGISNMSGPLLAYSRLAALDSDGTDVVPLGARERVQNYQQQSDGYIIDWLDGTSNKVLIARNYVPAKASANSIGSIYDGLGVDIMDTRTGKVDHIEMANREALFYLSDGAGNVRMRAVDENLDLNWQQGDTVTFSYRPVGSSDWKLFSEYSRTTDQGLYPVAVDAATNIAYSLKETDGRDAVYRTKLDGSMTTELVFAHPEVDVTGIVRAGRNGRVVGASYATDRREIVYFDPTYKALGDGLSTAVADLPLIRFVDSSADGSKQIIHASSDTNPGEYFLYESATKRMTLLVPARPELENVQLAPVKPITYRAADGTMVPGYLTLPLHSNGKNLPAIVMPHGGPAARDEWGFDWWAQFYANRGYAVLQPNFRGSTGYGDDWFQANGFKSWKTAIGDVNDAGRWLVSQGIADPEKLAIVGWSYGGYAALQANVLDPDLFKAVVAVAPVTDLGMLRGEQAGFTNMRLARDYIGEGPHIEAGSPARHASVFKAPVLMFHGDKDINVSVKEAREMDEELRQAGKQSELIVYDGIAHQLNDSEVRTDMLEKSEAFLRRTLKL